MAKRPITIQLEPTLIERIDAVRGDAARQAWIARAIEAQLDSPVARAATALADASITYHQTAPGPNAENIRSSTQAKRGVRERPKGGK